MESNELVIKSRPITPDQFFLAFSERYPQQAESLRENILALAAKLIIDGGVRLNY